MNWALGHIPIWVGGMSALAIPVMASGLAAMWLGETLRPIQLVGMGIVMASLAFVGTRSSKIVAEDPVA